MAATHKQDGAETNAEARRVQSLKTIPAAVRVVVSPEELSPNDQATKLHNLFNAFALDDDDENLDKAAFFKAIADSGLTSDDPRITSLRPLASTTAPISRSTFKRSAEPCVEVLTKALSKHFIIPDFDVLRSATHQLFLDQAQAGLNALSLCTVDGQICSFGASNDYVTLREISYCFAYLIARESLGRDVHMHVGREYSGESGRKVAVDANQNPHNPMVDIGALKMAALFCIGEHKMTFQDTLKHLAGGRHVGYSIDSFERERADAYFRLLSMAYMLKEKRQNPKALTAFPAEAVAEKLLQMMSAETTIATLSVMAATLANFGVCPITREKIFSDEAVRDLLAMMYVAGMDLYTGEYAFHVGFPSKGAMNGIVMAIVPGVMGVVTLTPPVESMAQVPPCMNFFKTFSRSFEFGGSSLRQGVFTSAMHSLIQHRSEETLKLPGPYDPRQSLVTQQARSLLQLVSAIKEGDQKALEECASTADIDATNGWDRTPLHIAVMRGNAKAEELLLKHNADPTKVDSFGCTPMDYKRK
eukprot:m.87675 g.87675  ORF g.87675 m.87675 type:complete len:531 (+) comp50986_c0_seq1:1006-2598(+)